MQSMMQVLRDTYEGRLFPQGYHVRVIDAGDRCLVLPDPDAHTTLCTVPTKNLARSTLFRIVLVNHQVGLIHEQERRGLDADDVRSSIAQCASDCEILELDEASS